jgi:hypothetical protein
MKRPSAPSREMLGSSRGAAQITPASTWRSRTVHPPNGDVPLLQLLEAEEPTTAAIGGADQDAAAGPELSLSADPEQEAPEDAPPARVCRRPRSGRGRARAEPDNAPVSSDPGPSRSGASGSAAERSASDASGPDEAARRRLAVQEKNRRAQRRFRERQRVSSSCRAPPPPLQQLRSCQLVQQA